MNDKIYKQILKNNDDLIKIRREFHQHPEIGFDEKWTSKKLKEILTSWGFIISKKNYGKTGFVATIKNGNSKKVLGLRAEMDALPVTEDNNLQFKSLNPGMMHACGHDGHMTMLLGALKYLSQTKKWNGKINAYFTPSEEGDFSGCVAMVKEKVFKDYPCDAIFAIHNMPSSFIPGGQLGKMYFYRNEGAIMAGVDSYEINLVGTGGHGSTPEKFKDVVTTALDIGMAIQTIVTRNISSNDKVVVNLGAIQAGHANNVCPEKAFLNVSVRSLTKETRKICHDRIYDLVTNIAKAYGVKQKIVFNGIAPTINDKKTNEWAFNVAKKTLGNDNVSEAVQVMGSEDFCAFLDVVPGSYAFICNGDSASVHSPQFILNEKILPIGSTYFAGIAEEFLK